MNRWKSVKGYNVYPHCSKASKAGFNDFVISNGFSELRVGTPNNMKLFLEKGKDSSKEYSAFYYLNRYVMKAMCFRNRYDNKQCIILQPYTYWESLELIRADIASWAKEYDIKAVVYDSRYSWYYPGMTILIVISLPGVDIKVKRLVEVEEREERKSKLV